MTSSKLALRALRELGPGPLALYARYQAALRSGWLRRQTPLYDWGERPLADWLRPGVPADPAGYARFRREQAAPFFFDPEADLQPGLRQALHGAEDRLLGEAEGLLAGRFRLFGEPVDLGFPPDWAAFAPLAGAAGRVDLTRHWSEYDLAALPADVKLLWEPCRFGWVYPLARAYRLTGEARFAEAFLTLLASWRQANRPNAGPHWASAQEAALRLLALAFATYAFAPALDPEALATLAQTVAVHAARIPPTLDYARAQGNNHLLSEAAALYTAGLLFPEFRHAARWRSLGRRWLAAGLRRQVFPDGGYVQHSVNYQRLALQVALWAARLAEVHGEPLPGDALDALRRLARALEALVDPATGRAPNFGPNDGALALPLTTCPAADHRPPLQAAARLLSGRRAFPEGPWEEEAFWLGAPEAPAAPDRRPDSLPYAGLFLLPGREARALVRCARFRGRPGHSDQLHLDLWWRGENLARDPGTYLYNGPEPWHDLAAAAAHNTLSVDGQEPMLRARRFLWLDWDQGRWLGRWRSPEGGLEALAGLREGYRRLGVLHRRTVLRAGDAHWLVADDALGGGRHRLRLAWLLPDVPWRLEGAALHLALPIGPVTLEVESEGLRLALYRAGERLAGEALVEAAPHWGWEARTYARLQPALALVAEVEADLPARLVSRWRLGEPEEPAPEVVWNPPEAERPAIAEVRWGAERLET